MEKVIVQYDNDETEVYIHSNKGDWISKCIKNE